MIKEIKAIYITALKYHNKFNNIPGNYVDSCSMILGKGQLKKRISLVEIRDFMNKNNIRRLM